MIRLIPLFCVLMLTNCKEDTPLSIEGEWQWVSTSENYKEAATVLKTPISEGYEEVAIFDGGDSHQSIFTIGEQSVTGYWNYQITDDSLTIFNDTLAISETYGIILTNQSIELTLDFPLGARPYNDPPGDTLIQVIYTYDRL